MTKINRRSAGAVAATTSLLAATGWQHTFAQPTGGKIKVGQIGVGHAHANKVSVYRESSDYEFVGIAEPDDKLRKRAQGQPAFADLKWVSQKELLEQDDLQVILVETEVPRLLDVAEECIAAGKHIHLDKPAGSSLPQFKRIVNAAREDKRMIQLGYMYRYNPGILLLHEFLRNGWLGEIFEIHTVMSKVVPQANRKTLESQGGGTMFELGCHLIDLVVGVLGKPDKISSHNKRSGKHQDNLIDNMLAIFDYPNATASIKSSAVEVDGFARRHFVVCGTEGTFHIQPLDRPAVRVSLSKERGEYKKGSQEIKFQPYQRYVGDAADMARVLRGEKENSYPYSHDLDVQQAILQASELPLQ